MNGVSYGTSPSTNTFPLVTGANTVTYTATSQIPGSATNDSASAGNIGEFISSTVLVGAAVNVPTATATNVTSIAPTAGDWDVSGTVVYVPAGGTTTTTLFAWTSTVSASSPTSPNSGSYTTLTLAFTGGGFANALPAGEQRQSLSGTTNVYLEAYCVISGGTMGASGFIGARRRR